MYLAKILLMATLAIVLPSWKANTPENTSSRVDRFIVSSADFPRRGPFRLHGLPPKGLESFLEFEFDFKDSHDRFINEPFGEVSLGGVLRAKPNSDQPGAKLERYGELNADWQVKWIDVIAHRYESAKLKRDGIFYEIVFTTQAVAGISYRFQGQFVNQPKFDRQDTSLTGLLAKYRNGQRVAEAKVDLVEWTFE